MARDEDEGDLFRRAMRDVKPLKRSTPRTRSDKVTLNSPVSEKCPSRKQLSRNRPAIPSTPTQAHPTLERGDIVGLDRRTGQRFKRGRLSIEARLDLHGMTQSEAHHALSAFLERQQLAGRRCVMVVTGKGVGKEGGGVLRNAVPRWLNEVSNRGKVLAFEYARQKDGGAGALYVLLRRHRAVYRR